MNTNSNSRKAIVSAATALAMSATILGALSPSANAQTKLVKRRVVNTAPPKPSNGFAGKTNVGIEATGAPGVPAILQGNADRNTLLESTTLDEFFDRLPSPDKPTKPDSERPVGAAEEGQTPKNGPRGRTYNVTRQKYSMKYTPMEIATFEPIAGFWLGSLLENEGLRLGLGSQREIPVPAAARAPYIISTNLPGANASRVVDQPSMSSAQTAINDIVSSTQASGIASPGTMSINITENYDAIKTAKDLSLDVAYAGARVQAALNTNRSANRHAVAVGLVERAFTASVDFQGRTRKDAFFNQNFTLDQAKGLVEQNRMGFTGSSLIYNVNPPNYIKSITYGRAVILNIVSEVSEASVRASLQGQYLGSAVDARAQEEVKNAKFELQVTTFGGPRGATSKLIAVDGINNVSALINSYLAEPAPLSTMVPISYAAHTMRDDRLAALQRTTEYTVTQYSSNPIGERYSVNVRFVPGGGDGTDNSLELFGSVRVGGLAADFARGAAGGNVREANQEFDMGTFVVDWYYGEPFPQVDVQMWEADDSSADDLMYMNSFRFDPQTAADTGNPVRNDQFQRSQNATSGVIVSVQRMAVL
jgi:Thiol-activated cytolysin